MTDLIKKWEGWSEDERNAALYQDIAGAKWYASPAGTCEFLDLGNQMGFREPQKWEVEPGAAGRCDDWARFVPRYTSPDSPRSLLDGLEEKVIEKVGKNVWTGTLIQVVAPPLHETEAHSANDILDYWTLVMRATAEQRALACWLVGKGREDGR